MSELKFLASDFPAPERHYGWDKCGLPQVMADMANARLAEMMEVFVRERAETEAERLPVALRIMGEYREQVKDYERVMKQLPFQDVDPAYEPVRAVLKKWSGKRGEGK